MRGRQAIAGLVAAVVAAAGVLLFSAAADRLSALCRAWPAVVWLLPVAGLASLALYRALGLSFSLGTRAVVADAGAGRPVPPVLALAIFCAACLTLACGGSVGKEAVALQLSVAAAYGVGALFRLDDADMRPVAMCGMAAGVSILLGTPVAAAVFAFELVRPGRGEAASGARVLATSLATLLLLVVAAALAAEFIAWEVSADSLVCAVAVPPASAALAARCCAVVCAATAAGALFCGALSWGRRLTGGHLPAAAWLVAGGLVYAAILWFSGCFEVAGTGVAQIMQALEGQVDTPFFAAKLVLTALLLACGFKGGEIMPTLCIGATLGCFLGTLLGGDAAFLAALGAVVAFSACTNCPLAAALLGVEAFGAAGAPWYVLGAAAAYLLTSRVSLYENTQRIGPRRAGGKRG